MEERLNISLNSKPCYDIVVTTDYSGLSNELKSLYDYSPRICVISDDYVSGIYYETVKEALSDYEVELFTFPNGEQSKTLDTVRDAYTFLIERKYTRKDIIIALGGGVTGDLAGYTAATYLRGIDFIQLPTTLLSMSDSSIGGKTGVDFDGFKNMVGAFKMPRLVYINQSTLKTLEDRQFYNGFAEVMKSALIKNSVFYEFLIDNIYEIGEKDEEKIHTMIIESLKVKKIVVEKDPYEKGDRALLNFGHTLGHAIEKHKNFSMMHGECVALGCVAAAFISWKREMISMDEYYEIRDMFVPFNLPISIEEIDADTVIEITKNDKKCENGKIKFILLKRIGKAVICPDVSEDELRAALSEITFTYED